MCGSSKGLPAAAGDLCKAIGRRLARITNVTIVSGGTKRRKSAFGADNFAADWFVVSAARAEIAADLILERIVTVARDDGGPESTRFSIGAAQRARGRTSEARRISFVRDLDGLIAIGGGDGTRQELALALEFGIKVLPVPVFDGAAAEMWRAYRSELVDLLRIDDERVREWEKAISSNGDPQPLADDMVGALLASLPKRCFVIMPFRAAFDALYAEVIEPAIVAAGDIPVRVDRIGLPGNALEHVESGLRTCDYAVAVLDQLRPNVLYELGAAHAFGKRVILLNQRGQLGTEHVPFDLATQQRLEYAQIDDELRLRLERVARSMSARSISM